MTAARIKKYKVGKRGDRGFVISLPAVQVQDLGVTEGDSLSMYKGILDGRPVLVLANSDSPVLEDDHSVQAKEFAAYMAANGSAPQAIA